MEYLSLLRIYNNVLHDKQSINTVACVTDFSIFSLRQTIGSLVQSIREFRTLLLSALFGQIEVLSKPNATQFK